MKKSYLLLLLLIPNLALAVVKEIVVTGKLDHGNNTEFFGFTPLVDEPVPFELRVQFDSATLDEDPALTHGVYESDGLPVSLRFGDYFYETEDTEVRVLSGHNGLWGFTFGNEHGFDSLQNGGLLHVEDYGLIGVFLSPFDGSKLQAPTDELKWLDEGFFPTVGNLSYVNITGTADGFVDNIRFQDSDTVGFTVSDVIPEPSIMGLLVLGLLAVSGRLRGLFSNREI